MDKQFCEELIQSGYIHFPLPLHQERSLDAERARKKVLDYKVIWDGKQNMPSHLGIGTMNRIEENGRSTIRVNAPTQRNTVPYEDGVTAYMFQSKMVFSILKENWEKYNRISFWVKPDSMGSHSVHLRIFIRNEGKSVIPDCYMREGQHLVNLVNHQWNQVIWEFDSLPRDCITELSIVMDADGQDTTTGSEFQFDFKNFELQNVEKVEKEKGWTCEENRIAYSMSGYHCSGVKTAVTNTGEEYFSVLDFQGKEVFHKKVVKRQDSRGMFEILDFTQISKPGYYQLKSGNVVTAFFEIGEKVMESVIWKVLNFIFCERCGYPILGKHGKCHTDVLAEHNGVFLSFSGGWHDAGDMSQQMLQTAEVTQEILELAERMTDNPLLHNRLLEEGIWGLEFTLRSRFGDGYRASSVGLGLWTDGFIGNADDVQVRVHNQAFQNFFCAAVEARAALAVRNYDPEMSWKCIQSAKEDYWFAKARFEEKGMEKPIIWEHTLNSGLSQYYAAAAWAAASIYENEPDDIFAREAEQFGAKLLACQETGTEGVPMKGFFYRDEKHTTIVHFTHQGRDHSFVQALEALCKAFPNSPQRVKWEKGMKLYGEYIKELFEMATPYGMLPAGLYSMTELEDRETFELLHLLVEYETEKVNYEAQLKSGIDLGNGYYVRMFPVWFSFRGNAAIQLSMGKAAAIVGKYFHDEKLKEIAVEQLYWMSGKNPFCQSFIYGEGVRYAQQDANYPGEMTGEMPVGVETWGNEDEPYWPSGNNATYKEVWLTPAGRWISIISELYPEI